MLKRIAAEDHSIRIHGCGQLKLTTLTPAQTQHEVGDFSDMIARAARHPSACSTRQCDALDVCFGAPALSAE